ncbi:MAG: YbjQ family protein [Dichotomicrobium sp.]
MTLYTVDRLSGRKVREGGLVTAYAVTAANIIKDVREKITNTFGGRMARYEMLVEETVERALARLEENARAQGYDGCLAVRISHPSLVEGGVEVVVYGTGFNFIDGPHAGNPG